MIPFRLLLWYQSKSAAVSYAREHSRVKGCRVDIFDLDGKMTSWLQVLLEFQRDWTRRETYEAARAILVEHAGGYGIGLDYARDMIKPA